MEQYILGIDIGTTGIRAMLVDHMGKIETMSYSEIHQFYPEPGWVEEDPEEIYRVTKEMIAQCLKNKNIAPARIKSIGIANQRDTTVLWNKRSGKPCRNAIVWQDCRTLPICEKLLAADGDEIQRRTGMVITTNTAATKIRWMLDHDVNARAALEKHELAYGTIDTWIVWKLSGGESYVTDHSNCSVTLLQNIQTLSYDEKVIKKLEIPEEILPMIRTSAEIYGFTDKKEFFGENIPISCVIGDQQAAAIGQSCFEKGMAKNTYGTGDFIVMNTGNQYIYPKDGIFSPVLYSYKNKIDYSIEGMTDICGGALNWLRDNMQMVRSIDEIEAKALSVKSSNGVIFVPAFSGLGSPYFDSYARGTIFGLTEKTTDAEICRAALEAMAFQVKDMFDLIQNKSGVELTQLKVDGGGTRSSYLLQFQADILRIPIEKPKVAEATCMGAVYMAGLASGFWTSMEEVNGFWKLEKRFEPQMRHDESKERYERWKDAVNRMRGWLKD